MSEQSIPLPLSHPLHVDTIRKRGTDYAGTCDHCDKRLLIEARGPRYAEISCGALHAHA